MREWRDVVGYEGFYEVSDDGQVRSITRTFMRPHAKAKRSVLYTYRGALMKHWINHVGGVPMVTLNANTRKLSIAVHRLVLMAFVGPCPDGMEACHYDGNPTNNHLSNLRWDTALANQEDKRRHGRMSLGERNSFAKLTNEQVRLIKVRIRAGEKLRRIADDYSVTPEAIGLIKAGKNWAWLEMETT
jgi:hypothetical protein